MAKSVAQGASEQKPSLLDKLMRRFHRFFKSCTARVLTIIARDGNPQIVGSVFKVQPSLAGVDHLLYGAVACWIDPDTGALGPAVPARTVST